jgi:hypothetical protein
MKARTMFRVWPWTIKASRQCFFCLGEVLADVMPWGFEYLAK